MNFTSDVAAHDGWELFDEDPDFLLMPVDGIDGDGGILDDNISCASYWHRSRSDFERSVSLLEPCGLILGCGHVGGGVRSD